MTKQLTIVSCCMGGNQVTAIDLIKPIADKLGMNFITISEWPTHDILWTHDTWLSELAKADIVVCCQRPTQPAKSGSRVTQAQSLGIPVCASPMLAYKQAIVHGETGFICDTLEEWSTCLTLLRDDADLRKRMGAAAQLAVQNYSIDAVGRQWLNLLEGLSRESCEPPQVDIVIPTWNNLLYLKECIKSIRLNTDWPCNIIVVNSGTDGTNEWLNQHNPDIIAYNHPTRLHFAAAVNMGIRLGKAPYVCILNDDTILAQHWLPALMHEAMKPRVAGVNPWSNCDCGWLHHESPVVGGVQLHPGMSYEQVQRIIPQLYVQRHEKVVTKRDWLAMFCTLIPRYIIDKVGDLDENFKSGCEDVDYCKRILAQFPNHQFVTTFDSWVFHFGGATRKSAENSSYEIHQREDRENQFYLQKKYAENPPQTPLYVNKPIFVLYTGPGWEKWSPKNVDAGGIGGSETCAVYVAREFARRGYQSIVYGDPGSDAGTYDGVEYKPYDQFDLNLDIDILVSSRRPDLFELPVKARKKICWVHDIWVHPDPKAYIFQDKIDQFFVLSPWHQEFFCKHHNIPREKAFITRNAIDLNRFVIPLPRVRGRMIYSSSPDRGLDVLLDCLPLIRRRVPEAHLKVFYGMDNLLKASKIRNNPHELAWIRNLESQLNQPGVEYVGRIGQKELANEFLQAELWAYPTAFTETSCITAIEAMAAGVPVVTSNLAALSTTVGVDGGVLLDGHNASEAYRNSFVELCCYVLGNPDVWQELSARGKRKSSRLGWTNLIDEWMEELK